MVLPSGIAPETRPSQSRVIALSLREEKGARRRNRTGLVRLTRSARRSLRLTGIGRRDRTCTCMGSRPRVSETRVYTLHHSPKNLVRTEGIAPSLTLVHRLLGPTRLLFRHVRKMEHPQGRAPCCLSYQDSPSLSTGWMHGRSGRTCTFVARMGIAFTARCICCSATLRKPGGSSGIRTRDRLLMRELRSLLRHRARMVGRLGNAPSSAA